MLHYTHNWREPYPRAKNWRDNAACRGDDTELYVPKPKEERGNKAVRYDRSVCENCPVLKDCLDYTLANNPPVGLWAGTLPKERDLMRKEYKGEKEHDFDIKYLVSYNSNVGVDSTIYDENTTTITGDLCDLLADDCNNNRYFRAYNPFE